MFTSLLLICVIPNILVCQETELSSELIAKQIAAQRQKDYLPNRMIMKYRITDYNNNNYLTPEGNKCIYPTQIECSQNISNPKCYYRFEFGFTQRGGPLYFRGPIKFGYINENGNIVREASENWDEIEFRGKIPLLIDVYSESVEAKMGSDGKLVEDNRNDNRDMFLISPSYFSAPILNNTVDMKNTYKGYNLNTTLTFELSLRCLSYIIEGSFCDLMCTRSTINKTLTKCVAYNRGYSYICEYVDNEQVDRCKMCPWGTRNDTFCKDEPAWDWSSARAKSIINSWLLTILLIFSIVILVVEVHFICRLPEIEKKRKNFCITKVFPV